MNVEIGQRLYRVGFSSVQEGIVAEVTNRRCVVQMFSRWRVNESALGKDWFLNASDARAELMRRLDEDIRRAEVNLNRAKTVRAHAAASDVEMATTLPSEIAL